MAQGHMELGLGGRSTSQRAALPFWSRKKKSFTRKGEGGKHSPWKYFGGTYPMCTLLKRCRMIIKCAERNEEAPK